MFAVGNPSFGYMSIFEFLKQNSISQNTTPFLYAHTPGTANDREGTETVYYYDHLNQKLHTISGAVNEKDLPNYPGSDVANNAAYIKPGHGFHVMAGGIKVTCVEPLLIGEYQCTSTIPNNLDCRSEQWDVINNKIVNTNTVRVGHYCNFILESGVEAKTATSKLAITPTKVDSVVMLNNFIGQGSVLGTVNTKNQTITVKGGQQVTYSCNDGSGEFYWGTGNTTPQNIVNGINIKKGNVIWNLLAVNDNASDKKITLGSNDFTHCNNGNNKVNIFTKKATNVSKNNDLVIKYTITNDRVSFECDNAFAIYPDDETLFHTKHVGPNTNNEFYCATWNCYDSFTGYRTISPRNYTGSYANPSLFGTYKFGFSNNQTDLKGEINFTIRPLAGTYDIVMISGFYPGADEQPVFGVVGGINGNNNNEIYIPGGQCVYKGNDVATNVYCLYGNNHDNDNLERDKLPRFLTMEFRPKPSGSQGNKDKMRLFPRLQVSQVRHNTKRYMSNHNWDCERSAAWDNQTADKALFGRDTLVGIFINQNASSSIRIKYAANMFKVNVDNSAPKYANGNDNSTPNVATITAAQGNVLVNTIIVKNANGNNGFSYLEDAAMMNVGDNAFALATIADDNMLAVNTINDTTSMQLYLQNGNGDVELTFNNLKAIGDNVRLYDAANNSYTALNATSATTTVNIGVNDSPLRFSLVWDAPIISGNELPVVDNNVDVFSPMQGTIRIAAGSNIDNVRIYNAAGMLVNSRMAAGQSTQFNNLTTGIYMVEVTTHEGTVVKKIDVK